MGEAARLVELERRYAPSVLRGPGVFSPADRNGHAPWNLGGDKMAGDRNGYADAYAEVLPPLYPTARVVVELGVFMGASLALWAELFPTAKVIGLDLDFDRFDGYRPTLEAAGAFATNVPELVTFDAYGPLDPLTDVLPGPVDLFVDDGPHTPDAVARVAGLVAPLMSERSVYVLEDFPGGAAVLRDAFPAAEVLDRGRWSAAVRL